MSGELFGWGGGLAAEGLVGTPVPGVVGGAGGGSAGLGALLALVAALSNSMGKVFQKRGTQDLPMLTGKPAVLRSYFGNAWWVVGFVTDVIGGLLTLGAVALAPVSIVQPILGSGLAFVAIFSHYVTGEALGRNDWMACTLCVLGTILVGLTTAKSNGEDELVVVVGGLLLVMFVATAGLSQVLQHQKYLAVEVAAAVSAGICFGLSGCATRGGMLVAQSTGSGVFVVLGVCMSVSLTAGGFVAQTRGLKEGRTLQIVTFANLTAMVVAILFGLLAFNEPLPATVGGMAGRVVALLMVVGGSLMLRNPTHGQDHKPLHRRMNSRDMKEGVVLTDQHKP